MLQVRKTIEMITNLAILVVCGLICWTFIAHRSLHFGAATEIGDQEARLVGQTIPSLPGHSWSSHQKTLVLAIRRGCHFCEESLPFYKQLGDREKSSSFHAHVLAVMPDDSVSGNAVLQSGGVAIDGVFNQKLDSIKVTGTPTLLLLDANGRIAQVWIGQLTAQREKEVIAAAEQCLPGQGCATEVAQ